MAQQSEARRVLGGDSTVHWHQPTILGLARSPLVLVRKRDTNSVSVPTVLVPKHLLPVEAQHAVSPSVCIVLENFRSLVWQHVDGDAVASLEGDFASFYTDGEGFRIIPIEIKIPLPITRSQLVLLDEQREAMEENCATAVAYHPNRAERAATDLVIKALAMKAYPDDIAHPYRVASKVCASLELEGARISRETVAQRLKTALACVTAKVTS